MYSLTGKNGITKSSANMKKVSVKVFSFFPSKHTRPRKPKKVATIPAPLQIAAPAFNNKTMGVMPSNIPLPYCSCREAIIMRPYIRKGNKNFARSGMQERIFLPLLLKRKCAHTYAMRIDDRNMNVL